MRAEGIITGAASKESLNSDSRKRMRKKYGFEFLRSLLYSLRIFYTYSYILSSILSTGSTGIHVLLIAIFFYVLLPKQ